MTERTLRPDTRAQKVMQMLGRLSDIAAANQPGPHASNSPTQKVHGHVAEVVRTHARGDHSPPVKLDIRHEHAQKELSRAVEASLQSLRSRCVSDYLVQLYCQYLVFRLREVTREVYATEPHQSVMDALDHATSEIVGLLLAAILQQPTRMASVDYQRLEGMMHSGLDGRLRLSSTPETSLGFVAPFIVN